MMLASNLARHARDHARALHPCSARSLWRSLALLLLLGLGTTPAHADLKLCNTTASRVGVSIGYKDAEGWATEGWWNIASHTCETLLKGVLIGRFYYIHAVDYDRGGEWAGNLFMCTDDKSFTIRDTKDCVKRGYKKTGFFEVDTGEERDWTVRLTDPDGLVVDGAAVPDCHRAQSRRRTFD